MWPAWSRGAEKPKEAPDDATALYAAQPDTGMVLDQKRMDWLELRHVIVREPLVYGSRMLFMASPEPEEGEENQPSDLRKRIDAALAATPAPAQAEETQG
jgi:hypothetical protein